jgi:hypothetical protein
LLKSSQNIDKLNQDSKDISEKVIEKDKQEFELRQKIDENKRIKDTVDLKYALT